MNRSLLAVVALCAIGASAVFAQEPAADAPSLDGPGVTRGPRWNRNRTSQPAPPDSAAEPANPDLQPAALLERAYAITRDLPLETRAYLLGWMVDPAARIEPQIAASWADELFQMAQELSDQDQQGRAELAAVRALAHIDVDHALAVFRRMDAATLQSGRVVPQDARSAAAETLFPEILRKQGVAAVPVLQQEAQRLGETGSYPYSAMALVMNELTHLDRSLGENVFADSVTAYQQSTPTLAGNADFVSLLHNVRWVPLAEAQQALTTVVNNLLSQPDDSGRQKLPDPVQYQGSTVDTATDYLLLKLLPQIRALQPDLLDTIAQSRPALAKAAGPASAHMGQSATSGTDPDQAVVNRIQRAAADNPQQALVASNQLQDPAVRSQALAAVASGMASKDPQQAAQLLSNAQDIAAKIDDKRKQLQAIVAMAQAANRMNNQAVLRDSLARGFALGNELLQLDEDKGTPPSFTLLAPLVRAGAHTQLETLVAGIQGIQNLQVKAQLLVLTAQSMPRPRRPARAQVAAGSPAVDKIPTPPTE